MKRQYVRQSNQLQFYGTKAKKPLRNTNITIIKGIFNGKLLVHIQSATGNLSIHVEISVVKSVILIEIKRKKNNTAK